MLHVPGMPEGVHVSFSPEDQPVSAPAQPDRYTPPALVGAGMPSAALTALLDAHELAYGHALCSEAYGLPDLADRRQAEEEAFRALLHTPLHSDPDRVAYAIAVISRQMHSLGDASATERDHPMAVAYRNLRFGEHTREPKEMHLLGGGSAPEASLDPALAFYTAALSADAEMAAFQKTEIDKGDPSNWFRRESELGAAQIAAHDAAWQAVPTTYSGRRALVAYAHAQIAAYTGPSGDVSFPDLMIKNVVDAFSAAIEAERFGTPEDTKSHSLLVAIEQEWAAQIIGEREDYRDLSTEADERSDARSARREALMTAAEALPAGSREARHAKALAFAWDSSIMLWQADRTRDQYGTDGRLMIDLMDSLIGEPRSACAGIPTLVASKTPSLDLSGYSNSQLCALFDVYERAEDQFHTAAWWPKLGEAGSQAVTDEGDRCMALKGAVADELLKRQPRSGSEADERAEKLMRRAVVSGDWKDIARLACGLRNEVAACQGKH